LPGVTQTFATVVGAAQERGEVAIGYRAADARGGLTGGIVINPYKSQTLLLDSEDQLIVLKHPETTVLSS